VIKFEAKKLDPFGRAGLGFFGSVAVTGTPSGDSFARS